MIEQITELQAIAQTGLTYCKDKFDKARYKRLLEITAELLALKSDYQYEKILEFFAKEAGHSTPKIDIRGAVFKNDQMLLVQEKSDGLWSVPGGWADVNLSPSENVIKEIKEEAGFSCSVSKLIGIFDKRKNNLENFDWPHVYKLLFLCKIDSLEQDTFDEDEILDVSFFNSDDIPPLSKGRIDKQQIDLCFKHFYDQALHSVYD